MVPLGNSQFSVDALPRGSVCVFIDESYDPQVAAAAVSIEPSQIDDLEGQIGSLYESLAGDFQLSGLGSYEEFVESGFHATGDTLEVKMSFIRLLAHSMSFKTSIVFSDGTFRPELSKKKRLMFVFDRLMRDVFRQYKRRPRVHLVFESAGVMDQYVERVLERTRRRLRGSCPPTTWEFRSKADPFLLAVPDYVLHIFNRWYSGLPEAHPIRVDKSSANARNFAAVLGAVSEARSIEGNYVIRRNEGLEALL